MAEATRYGTWVGYDGNARAILAGVLLAAALLVVAAGSRIRRPVTVPQLGGRRAQAVLLAGWALALIAFIVGFAAYARQTLNDYPHGTAPPEPVRPFTLAFAVVTGVVIARGTHGPARRRVANGVIGAFIAPMIFELPFDLVVMTRTYPPLEPHPGLYRAAFFGPLFLVELTTMALLLLAPAAVLSRAAMLTLAAMLVVFAGWATVGFGFPSSPTTLAFNVTAKFLAFLTTIGLFLPHWPHAAVDQVRGDAYGDH